MAESSATVLSGFLDAASRFPNRCALEVDGERYTYAQLTQRAKQLANALDLAGPSPGGPALTAIYAARGATTYCAVLAAFMRGRGYVPINPNFPAARCRSILERSECTQLIVDSADAVPHLEAILEGIERSLDIIVADVDDGTHLASRWPQHTIIDSKQVASAPDVVTQPPAPDALACLLFTSGSTGIPKGVMVTQRNVRHFIDVMRQRYEISEHDRFTQLFEMTFDLSMFDMFMSWLSGACLCVPSRADAMMLGRYILESQVTVWFSVPSFALLMKRMRLLEPDYYPKLRLSLFCGEALPVDVTRAWAQAAPNSVVENLYGPTELTIACTAHRWCEDTSPHRSERGIVPIGEPNPGLRAIVVDDALNPVADGETGELLVTGAQLTQGYWRDEEKTAMAFVTPPGEACLFYRTGDLVRRAHDGLMTFLGRRDSQIQVRGYRVELSEVESAIREVTGTDSAIALGWPRDAITAENIVAFIRGTTLDVGGALEALRCRLPAYMVPKEIHVVTDMPLNTNGKIDRNALADRIDAAAD